MSVLEAPRAPVVIAQRRGWDVVAVLCLLWTTALAVVNAFRGRHNADEGFYLGAARAVLRGDLPYVDFAFTQTPLLPYVYAPVQALTGPSLLAARLTSVALLVVALVLAVLSARSLGGAVGGAITAFLLAAYPPGAHWLVILKSYPLTAVCLVLTAAALVLGRDRPWRWPVTALAASAAVAGRQSAAVFAAVVVAYCLVAAPRRQRRVVAAVVAAVGAVCLVPVLLAPRSAHFSLLGYHDLTTVDRSVPARLADGLTARLPMSVAEFPHVWGLAALSVGLVLASPGLRAWVRTRPEVVVVAAAVAAFTALHLFTGPWYLSYTIPVVPVTMLLVGAVLGRAVSTAGARLRAGVAVAVLVAAAFGVGQYGLAHDADLRGTSDLDGISAAAAALRDRTQPDDRVVALEAQVVVEQAGRRTAPGLSLAQFSYLDLPTERARQARVVNEELLRGLLLDDDVTAVVLTSVDETHLARAGALSARPGNPDELRRLLDERFAPVWSAAGYGQVDGALTLYVRR